MLWLQCFWQRMKQNTSKATLTAYASSHTKTVENMVSNTWLLYRRPTLQQSFRCPWWWSAWSKGSSVGYVTEVRTQVHLARPANLTLDVARANNVARAVAMAECTYRQEEPMEVGALPQGAAQPRKDEEDGWATLKELSGSIRGLQKQVGRMEKKSQEVWGRVEPQQQRRQQGRQPRKKFHKPAYYLLFCILYFLVLHVFNKLYLKIASQHSEGFLHAEITLVQWLAWWFIYTSLCSG